MNLRDSLIPPLDQKPCKNYKRYKGIRQPRCGCAPCWKLWIKKQKAENRNG